MLPVNLEFLSRQSYLNIVILRRSNSAAPDPCQVLGFVSLLVTKAEVCAMASVDSCAMIIGRLFEEL